MTDPKIRWMDNIEDLKSELLKVKSDWIEVKSNMEIHFPEYTDEKIEELEYLLNKKSKNELDDIIKITKGNTIITELTTMHFKGGIDLSYILHNSYPSERIQKFIKYNQKLNDKDYWSNLSLCYQGQDYSPVPYPILFALFNSERGGVENLMNDEELSFFGNLPNDFTIYRAMSKKEMVNGRFRFSWTLSEAIAEKFRERNELLYSDHIVVHSITVNKKNVLAYLNGRKEEEIIYIQK